jgi:hypothetical protein
LKRVRGHGDFKTGRCNVALRFQENDDVDREAKTSGTGLGCGLLSAVVFGAFYFAWDVFISRKSIDYASRHLGEFAIFVVAVLGVQRLVGPKYQEFRIRTKEILGMVTEIEEVVSEVREDQKELLERVSAVEKELRSLKYQG